MEKEVNNVFLLLGGNLGDIQSMFKQSKTLIEQHIGQIISQSKLYQSKAWGFEASSLFLNQVLLVTTNYLAPEVLDQTQKIETELGRIRNPNKIGFESRNIDIDILYFNDDIINTDSLKIPHYALHERMFTLKPLEEIAPMYVHPRFKKTNKELLSLCQDHSVVTPV